MGSIGIASGQGRMNREQLEQIRGTDSGILVDRLARANTIVVYAGTKLSSSANKSAKKWGERLKLDNPSRGYAIAMTGATKDQKIRLLNAVNSAFNRTQEKDEKYEKYANRLIDQARTWKRANGMGSLTSAEIRVIREIANSTKQRATIDKIIEKDREKNNKLFGGRIRTRRLTKSDV